ncbi:hypothetical protein [uncultured Methanofollis sp.]|uniref:hypothetical protein n=1 Tax=uncultured Methanofollis sp. TaxID=262500 RepID=UPI00260B42E0|nr:hypothetical protein [uncultured Methanofollis sp.]
MTVNQAQVDQILGAASADDPEVKLANLEREVDLVKTSVKKLLIDIRERMNEMENPFTFAASAIGSAPAAKEEEAAEEEDVEEEEEDVPETPAQKQKAKGKEDDLAALKVDENLLSSLHAHLAATQAAVQQPRQEKLRLQKVHRLFEWTGKAVKKYGYDRLEMMLDSYASMGYLSPEEVSQVKEIARLMPASLGEADEIKAEEFVSELYVLNRILDPNDTTLDRDMIEVLMDRKRPKAEGEKTEEAGKDTGDDWVKSLERI